MKNTWIKRKWLFLFSIGFSNLENKENKRITLRDKVGYQLAIKHAKIVQKRISIITLELGSQPPLNNHQFNFDNNSIFASIFKISRTKDEQIPTIYKDIRQVQQQLNYTNHCLQHLNQQTTKNFQFLFSFVPGWKISETSKSTFS